MLIAPLLVGLVLRVQQVGWAAHLPLLGLAWFIGYFLFFYTGVAAKARAVRRVRAQLVVYACAATVFGVGAVLLQPALLGWVPVFAPLLALGLALAWLRRDRSVLSGLVTVAAACLMCLVVRYPSLAEALAGVNGAGASERGWAVTAPAAWPATLWLTGYFTGTVFYVKTMIRQRGSAAWLLLSVTYHLGWAVLAAVVSAPPAIVVFFLIAAGRAAAVPGWWPMRGRSLSPQRVGIGEAVLSTVLVVLLVW